MSQRAWNLERPARPFRAACRDFLHLFRRQRAEPVTVPVADRREARERDERTNVLVELLPDGILVVQSGIIMFANSAAAEIHGAEQADQLIGLRALDLVHPDDHELVIQRRAEVERAGHLAPIVRKGLRLDGTRFTGETRAAHFTWNGESAILLVVRDVTEREQAREILRESEIRIRGILENVADGVITIGERGTIQSFNPAAEEIFGYPADEVVGRNISLLVADPDHGRHDGYLRDYLRTGTGRIVGVGAREVTARRKDGTSISIELSVGEMQVGGSRTFIGALRNVTERKRTEKALHDSEARYRSLFEIAPEAILVTDYGKILFCNPAAIRLFGAENQEQLVGMNQLDLVHPDDWPQVKARIDVGPERTSSLPTMEIRRLRIDGSEFTGESLSAPFIWNGQSVRLVIIRDVTERERANKALLDAEARYRGLIEGSPLGIQISSRAGKRRFANPACVRLFGYDSAEDLLAAPQGALRSHHEAARSKVFGDEFLESGVAVSNYEFDARRKDGSIIPLQTFIQRITWDGEEAIQRTYFDLTERKKAEEQLRQAQKMEVVGQLTGGVAHDFNNLLTVVLGNLELLEGHLEDADSRRLAGNALDASRRGAELTQRLLAFSRKQALEPRSIDLNDLLSGMSDLMRRTLGAPIEIEMTGGEDLWRCEADPAQLENAVLNLAINARDAMPRGGKLIIETANVTLDRRDAPAQDDFSPGRYIMISVADTGVGMPQKVVERVFEPFFTTKDVGQGSGLGLSMVYGFIKQSGGHVAIESEVGAGTRVKLYLPMSPDPGEPAKQDPEDIEPLSRGEKILVVEDDADVRALIVALLGGLGYDIVQAADGQEAIEALQSTPAIDLLFTDVVLPGGMSGADLAAEATRHIAGIKVLYASGFTDNVLVQNGQLDPDVQFIGKPFRKGLLAQKVRAVLDAAAA